MLLTGYRLEVFNNQCMPGAMTVNCFAHLDQDVSAVLPYLNAVLGGLGYVQDPPAVTFQAHGKLITVHSRKIAVNALQDKAQARKIIDWLQREINQAWEKRAEITPRYTGAGRPQVIDILKALPRTNCRECGSPTCMVFAVRIVEGVKGVDDCPPLDAENKKRLQQYLVAFEIGT